MLFWQDNEIFTVVRAYWKTFKYQKRINKTNKYPCNGSFLCQFEWAAMGNSALFLVSLSVCYWIQLAFELYTEESSGSFRMSVSITQSTEDLNRKKKKKGGFALFILLPDCSYRATSLCLPLSDSNRSLLSVFLVLSLQISIKGCCGSIAWKRIFHNLSLSRCVLNYLHLFRIKKRYS